MKSIDITTERAIQALDVTELITAQTWADGFLLVSIPHTTAALVLGENDPEMLEDYEKAAAGLPAPFEPFKHHRNDNPNAAAHIISSFAGTQLIVPVVDGSVMLGTWQRIIFIELDGPKARSLLVGSLAAIDGEA
jgi:secondary thiamine-phosphate synthase enzyme